jgi:hypothetical protein
VVRFLVIGMLLLTGAVAVAFMLWARELIRDDENERLR